MYNLDILNIISILIHNIICNVAYYIYDNEYSVYIANECLGKQVFETLSHGFTFRVLKRKGQQVWSPLSQA